MVIPHLFGPTALGHSADWDQNKIEKFLMDCGYHIVLATVDGEVIHIATKNKDEDISSYSCDNISKVFVEEIQDILLKWLLRIR